MTIEQKTTADLVKNFKFQLLKRRDYLYSLEEDTITESETSEIEKILKLLLKNNY